MSRSTVYICDACDKTIGNKPHITLLFVGGNSTGIALPPQPERTIKKGTSLIIQPARGWRTVRNIPGTFHQLHNGKCASVFFERLMLEAIKQS